MITNISSKRKTVSYRVLSAFIAFTFALNLVLPPGYAQMAPQNFLNLPAPGTMLSVSAGFAPALVKGITINPDNPLQFEFFISKGDSKLGEEAFKEESKKLIKYFLASLTVPEEELWVNLSPYEKDRIIPQGFGETEMGRDMLAQDYILKQLTASLMYPEKELGKKFWDEVYKKAQALYGTTEIPMDTFNKVWIVPDKAVVYEHGNSVFVVDSHLKVMLEQDYQAMSQGAGDRVQGTEKLNPEPQTLNPEIIREIIIPALEKEVNEGKSFATLRQIYHSSILAVWYKQNLQKSLLGQVYADQNKIKGIDLEDKNVKQKIYNQYLEAFKKGVYNYIKEDYDPATRSTIPRKYFSGGTNLTSSPIQERLTSAEWKSYPADVQQRIRNVASDSEYKSVVWEAVENATPKEIALATRSNPEPAREPAAASSSPIDYQYWTRKRELGEADVIHMKSLVEKFDAPKIPLGIGKNFLPSALLTDQERSVSLGAIDYKRLAQDATNAAAAQNVVVTFNPMDGGLGTSVKREAYLEKEISRARDSVTGRVPIGAKATDLFFNVTEVKYPDTDKVIVLAKPEKVSIAEIKLLHVIDDVSSQYGSMFFQPLVNADSAPSYIKLLDSIYLPDRVDAAIPGSAKRTYRQVMAEKGVRLVAGSDAMLYQKDLPVIDLETKELTDKYTAPGGHGQWGVRLLLDALNFRLPNDGKTHIRAFYNGDGVANFPDASIIGWMAKENVPVVVVSTTKTGADKKGGQLGIQILRDGSSRPQILELAQAKKAEQGELFGAIGLPGHEKVLGDNAKEYTNEEGKQYFNTNIAILNYNVLTPILNELAQLDQVELNGEILPGRKVVERIISPDLIENKKEKADGKEYTQLEGAIGSSLLNLNAFFVTTKDERVKALLARHGVEKLLRIVDADVPNRTKFFTPVKNAFDFWFQAYSDYYKLDTKSWTLRDTREGLVPPAINFTGPKRNGQGDIVYDRKGEPKPEDFYDDVQNMIDAFGTASTKELISLNIEGKVLLKDAVLKKNVVIESQYPFVFDLNSEGARRVLGQEGKQPLVLYNIKIAIAEDGSVSSEYLASSPVASDNEDIYSSLEEESAGIPVASSPIVAVDEIARREVPKILQQMDAVYGLSKDQAAGLTGNPFAQIGFDGDANRMGWTLNYLNQILQNSGMLRQTLADARHIRDNYENVIFIGMGGSGLGVEVIKSTFGKKDGIKVFSLRTTDPAVVDELTKQLSESSGGNLKSALEKTKIEVISKTFTTQEVLENQRYFEGLYRDLGIENVTSHFTLVTDPGSKLDVAAAQKAGYEVRNIQLNNGTDIGGRNTTFTNINLLPLAILAPEKVTPFLQEAWKMNQKNTAVEDTFAMLGIYLHYMATQNIQRKDKVTFIVPEELRALPMWSEQLIEESLGKDGKGITVVYGEDLTAQKLQNPDFTKDRVFLRFNLGGHVTRPDLAQVLSGREDVFDINVESIDQIGGLMLGLQRTVATIAYRWDINFVNQPGVQGYKAATNAVMSQLKEGQRVEVPGSWEYGTFGKLRVYYAPFIEAGITTKEELGQEAASLGSDLNDGAAVYAALLNIARRTGKFELAEIASYGHMNPTVWNVMQEARTDIFTDRFAMASKLGEGPDRNHSFHQSVEQGPDYHFSTYLMPLETTQPRYRAYDENPLRAQTLGTVESLIKAKRKVVLVSIDGKIADSEPVLKEFFTQADSYLAASSPVARGKVEVTFVPRDQLVQPIAFGTSGWRTQMDGKRFTLHNAGRVAQAVAFVFKEQRVPVRGRGKTFRFGVTYGGRRMSQEAAQRAVEALRANGMEAVMGEDIATTPTAMALTGKELGQNALDAVLHFDASHNPVGDNGMKFFVDGVVAPDSLTALIAAKANDETSNATYKRTALFDHDIPRIDVSGQAMARYRSEFSALVTGVQAYQRQHPGMKIIVDALHGSSGRYLDMFKEMGATIIRTEPLRSGTYPKTVMIDGKIEEYRPEPIRAIVETAQEFKDFEQTAAEGAIYFAIDGDADRLAAWVKKDGKVQELLPNDLGVLFGWYLIASGQASGATQIVKTLPTTAGMDALARWAGKKLVVTPVGSKNFAPYLAQMAIATEESGHQVIRRKDKIWFDDAVVEAMLLLEIMVEKDQSPASLLSEAQREIGYSSVYRNKKIDLGPALKETLKGIFSKPRELAVKIQQAVGQQAAGIFVTTSQGKVVTLDELEQQGLGINVNEGIHLKFSDGSWVQPRLSGTEPIARIYSEAPTEAQRERLSRAAVSVLGIASSPVISEDSHFDEDEILVTPPASSPVNEPSPEVELLNLKDRSPHWIVNMNRISGPDSRKRIELINEDGTTTSVFVPMFEYKISRGTDEFGRLTFLSNDGFIYVHELSISEKYAQKGIGFTVYNWLARQALENGQTLRMRTRSEVELKLSQEMLTDIKVGGIGRAFVPLADPQAPIINDPTVKQLLAEGKDVEVHGRPNPPLLVFGPGAEMTRNISNLNVADKKVFLRVDHNGMFQDGKVTSKQRINANTPTVTQLFENGARLVIMATHAEKPQGQVVEAMSPRPVADYLKGVFPQHSVVFMARNPEESPDAYLDRVKDFIDRENPKGILYLDNLRFDPREQSKNLEERKAMAKQLRALADVYVNDAFSVSHRSDISVYELAYQFTPEQRAGGISFQRELAKLYGFEHELGALKMPKESLAVIAGSKLGGKEGKLHLLKGFSSRVNKLRVEGLLAVTFLKSEVQQAGRYDIDSLIEKARGEVESVKDNVNKLKKAEKQLKNLENEKLELKEAADLMEFFNRHKALGYVAPSIVSDFVAVPVTNPNQTPIVITREEFLSGAKRLEDWNIIDTGPEELDTLKKEARESALVFWNGSLGWTNMPAGPNAQYGQKATWDFAQYLATLVGKVKVAIGGGNTIADAQSAGLTLEDAYAVVLLGGGASQEFLIQVPLPGIQPLLNIPFDSPYITPASSPVEIDSWDAKQWVRHTEDIYAGTGDIDLERILELVKASNNITTLKTAVTGAVNALNTFHLEQEKKLSTQEQVKLKLDIIWAIRNAAMERLRILELGGVTRKKSSSPVENRRQSSDVPLTTNPGGINLNPALLDLQIKRDANFVPLPLPQQPIQQMHIEGFIPVIINITPVTNLPMLLGLADTKQDTEETTPAMKAREPEEVSVLN